MPADERDRVVAQPRSAANSQQFEGPGQAHGLYPLLILAGLTLLAAALRFYRLGDWGFDSDEVFMQRDSINLRLSNPRPLMYFLNHYVVLPFGPLDELGLRLLPALCGVLAVPALYLMARRIVGTRSALFGAFFLATSSLLIYYSQFGRYWTLVFLLSCIYPYALYLGIRDGSVRMLTLGTVTGVLAVLAHPVAILPIGGLGLWVVALYLRRDRLVQLWSHTGVRWAALVAVVLVTIIAVRFIPLLQHWIQQHDSIPLSERGGEFLLHTPGGQGVKQVSLMLAYIESLTLPLVLAGISGMYLLWYGRSQPAAALLACLFVFPIAFIMLVSTRTAVSTFYLVPAIPPLFMGSGVLLDRLILYAGELRPRWLLAAVVATMVLAAGAPTTLSQYRDGRRWDFRGAARWLNERLKSGDVIFSDQPQVLAHYLPGKVVQRLVADPDRLMITERGLRRSGEGGLLWIVSPAPSHAFRTNPRLTSLNAYMYQNCQLRNTIGVGRVDFRQNFLQVYRCPPDVGAKTLADR